MSTIIFLAGHKNHGKDYLYNLFYTNTFYTTNNYDITPKNFNFDEILQNKQIFRFAFADQLKKEFCSHYNLSIDELEKSKSAYRKQLQDFSLYKLNIDKNYYTNFVLNQINELLLTQNNSTVFITDFRKPEECYYFQEHLRDDSQISIRKWLVIDDHKDIDLKDEWENNLNSIDFDIIFKII